jgi:hypothetical protein
MLSTPRGRVNGPGFLLGWIIAPPAGQDANLPSWMKTIDRFTFGRSAAMGIALLIVR